MISFSSIIKCKLETLGNLKIFIFSIHREKERGESLINVRKDYASVLL